MRAALLSDITKAHELNPNIIEEQKDKEQRKGLPMFDVTVMVQLSRSKTDVITECVIPGILSDFTVNNLIERLIKQNKFPSTCNQTHQMKLNQSVLSPERTLKSCGIDENSAASLMLTFLPKPTTKQTPPPNNT